MHIREKQNHIMNKNTDKEKKTHKNTVSNAEIENKRVKLLSGKVKNLKSQMSVEAISAILVVAILYFILHVLDIGCPIKFLTGISCAGCGMTRAWLAAFHLDFKEAFYYHPLFLLPPVVLAIVMLKPKMNQKVYKILIFTSVASFVIIYAYRLVRGDNEVVAFKPQDGMIYQIIKYLISIEVIS